MKALTWSSLKGDHFRGTVVSHLVREDGTATLCGKPKGRMTNRGYSFDPKTDCKLCADIQTRGGIRAMIDFNDPKYDGAKRILNGESDAAREFEILALVLLIAVLHEAWLDAQKPVVYVFRWSFVWPSDHTEEIV